VNKTLIRFDLLDIEELKEANMGPPRVTAFSKTRQITKDSHRIVEQNFN
jgi:hypothetical protein